MSTLVTGFPSTYLAVRVIRKLLATDANPRIRCLVPERFQDQAIDELARMGAQSDPRIDLIEGDTTAMDLGLGGREFLALASDVRVIHHCAAVSYFGADRRTAKEVNVGGAREIVELAEAASGLERLIHWSTAHVSGARRGQVLESDLSDEWGFRNPIDHTRFRAERIVRSAAGQVPITVVRPSILVGDSNTGEIDRLEGPSLLVLFMLNAPADLRMPMPSRGHIPLNMVPIDYVVDASLAIVSDPRSLGRTFHIVDPNPLSVHRVFELIAEEVGRPVPRPLLPTQLAATLLRAPGLDRFVHGPRAFLDQLATEVNYDDRNAREILSGQPLRCPPFTSYVKTLVEYARGHQHAKRRHPTGIEPASPAHRAV